MLPVTYGKNAWWFRFSKYDISENEKGIYIIPALKSERIVYNPFNHANDLILDYLNYGKAVFEGMDEKKKINEAVNLVKKYGLLGIYTFKQYKLDQLNSQRDDNDFAIHLYYDDGEFIGEKSFQEYIYEFFPFQNRQPFLNKFSNDTEQDLLQFQKNYSERVEWIAKKAEELYNNFKNITDFRNTDEIENVPNLEYFNKVLDCKFRIKNVDLFIECDEDNGPLLNWSADNLLKTIDIAYALKLIDKKNGLAKCKNCGNPFVKRRRNGEYCSPFCGNSYRVKKCNSNKKGVD